MMNGGVTLVGTSLVSTGSNVSVAKLWNGGQGVIVVSATQYAPIVNLMLLGGSGAYIKVSALTGNDIIPYSFPAGTYVVHSATGSSINLHVSLMPTI